MDEFQPCCSGAEGTKPVPCLGLPWGVPAASDSSPLVPSPPAIRQALTRVSSHPCPPLTSISIRLSLMLLSVCLCLSYPSALPGRDRSGEQLQGDRSHGLGTGSMSHPCGSGVSYELLAAARGRMGMSPAGLGCRSGSVSCVRPVGTTLSPKAFPCTLERPGTLCPVS